MIRYILASTAITLVAGCSDSTGPNAALSVPGQMTIIDAQGTGGSSPADIPRPGSYAIDGSDYMTDPVDVWVHDESMESLNMVNMIMCSMGHTRFDHSAVFNKGPYTALVGCEEGREDRNASAGQVEFDEFTVDSSRVAGQPHIVKFWFDENDSHGGGPSVAMRFYGKLTIYESPSSARPFGRFTMSWKQLLTTDDPVTGTPQMTGSLSTVDRTDGKVEFVLFNVRGDVNAPVGVGEEAFRMRGRVVTYVFKKSTLTLQLSGVDVALANGVSVNAGQRMNGLDCGPLVTTALTNLSQMPSQTGTYNWRTGSNNWNRFQTVKDANGAFVTFAQPLRFNYTHTGPGNPNDGKTFTLDLEGEQRMNPVADPNAVIAFEGFDLNVTLTPPTSRYVDPAIGARPVVTTAPKFIEGVLQN